MKHFSAPYDYHGKAVFDLGDDQIQAQVFAELEAQRQERAVEEQLAVPILHSIDDQNFLQRFCKRWFLGK